LAVGYATLHLTILLDNPGQVLSLKFQDSEVYIEGIINVKDSSGYR